MKQMNETKLQRKSLLSILLIIAVIGTLAFGLAACGKTETPDDTEYNNEADSGAVSDTEDTTDTSAEESEETTAAEQEMLGTGTEDDPYLATPIDMAVNTKSIPAGGTSYYAIYRTGGKMFAINDENAYVVCEGVTYNAENGVVSFKVPDALASDAVLFEIGNKGSADAVFTVEFSDVPGSLGAPIAVDTLGEDITVSIPEGTTQGYYYSYIAEKAGTIRFYMTASVEAGMTVDRIRNGSEVIQLSMSEDKVDAEGKQYIDVEVNEGDVLSINVSAIPNMRGKYPAVDVTWSGTYN